MRTLILLFIFLILQGCSLVGSQFIREPPRPPKDAVSEISAYGITLTIRNIPYPESLDIEILPGSPSYARTPLRWYFEPHPEYNQMDVTDYRITSGYYGIIDGIPSEHIKYTYLFLIEDEHSSTVIPSNPDDVNINGLPNSYSGETQVFLDPKDLIINGNFILEGRNASIPLTATHIEVMVQLPDSNKNTSVAKISLDQLAAWNRYIKPLIPLPD